MKNFIQLNIHIDCITITMIINIGIFCNIQFFSFLFYLKRKAFLQWLEIIIRNNLSHLNNLVFTFRIIIIKSGCNSHLSHSNHFPHTRNCSLAGHSLSLGRILYYPFLSPPSPSFDLASCFVSTS